MNAADIANIRTDLLTYAQLQFRHRHGYDFVTNWHHRELCTALERVAAGYCKRLVINMPPRYSKTELAVVRFISWCMGNWPDSEFIHASYSKRLATKNAAEVRADIESAVFSDVFGNPQFRRDTNAKDEFRTLQGGIVYATGSEGTITGYGAGKMRPGFGGAIIIDDPHKAGEATSDTMRQNVLDWYSTTMESRRNSEDTPVIVIMQRLHEKDLAGWLLDGGTGETWEHLMFPALGPNDEPLWEFKHTKEALYRLRDANSYVFSGQYMQQPSPLAGNLIKPDMINLYDAAPRMVAVVRGWDLAASQDKGDYTVGVKMGLDEQNRVWILDVVRGRERAEDVERRMRATAERDGPGTLVSAPQDPGQAGKAQVGYLGRMLMGHTVEFSTETGDKVTRATPFASQVNLGNVNMVRAAWNDQYISELRLFPYGTYDDQVDASSRAFNTLAKSDISRFMALAQ